MASPSGSSNPQFQHQHKFRVNPTKSYSERMTTTRAELRQIIKQALCEFTGEPNAQMRWTRFSYMRDIVARYRIRIEGWPLDEVPFKNLSDVPNLPKLELLMRGWKDGTIRFVALSEAQYEEMVRDPSPWIGPAGPDAEGEAEDGNH
ncbi:hypothetical protein C8Q74DRAFT_1194858 [Fomes fomentarius]|nr:hypothetical protein C8Q74DRAFT_1194858 [Fomes fomentarius]